MDPISLPLVGLIAGSAAACGVRLYATIAILGYLGRSGLLGLPPGLQVLTHPWVILIAAALYVVEFVADKIPIVDSVWDTIHTFIRVPAAVLLGFAAFGGVPEPMRTIAALVAGGVALSAHGLKASARAAINTSPEPVTNWVASFIEEGLVAALLYLAVKHPLAALVIAASIIVIFVLALRWVIRTLRRLSRRSAPSGRVSTAD